MSPVFAIITGPEIAIVVVIAVLLFGADRIPKLARSMGEAKKEFEAGQAGRQPQPGAAPAPPAPPAPSAEAGAPPNPPPPTQQP